MKVAKKIAP
jgi:hypothetical protein